MSETSTEQLDEQLLHTIDVEEVPHIRKNKTYPNGHPIQWDRTLEERIWDCFNTELQDHKFKTVVTSPSDLPDKTIADWWNIIVRQNKDVTLPKDVTYWMENTENHLHTLFEEIEKASK